MRKPRWDRGTEDQQEFQTGFPRERMQTCPIPAPESHTREEAGKTGETRGLPVKLSKKDEAEK